MTSVVVTTSMKCRFRRIEELVGVQTRTARDLTRLSWPLTRVMIESREPDDRLGDDGKGKSGIESRGGLQTIGPS